MDESRKAPRIEIQDIDHLGIVSGIVDEIGLVDLFDQKLGTHPQEHVSQATDIVKELTREREDSEQPVYELRDKMILGKLDLRHRIIKVAIDIQNCTFQDEVDLRYCEFKQTVNFSECRFRKDLNSGDETESKTIYRKDLICNRAIFEEAVGFNGAQFENSVYFNNARFLNEKQQVGFAWAVSGNSFEFHDAVFWGPVSFNSLKSYGSVYKVNAEKR